MPATDDAAEWDPDDATDPRNWPEWTDDWVYSDADDDDQYVWMLGPPKSV